VATNTTGVTDDVRREVYALFDEGEEIYRRLGDENGLGNIAWGRGIAVSDLDDDIPSALELFRASIDHYRRAGNEFGTGWGMFEVAIFSVRSEDYDTAQENLVEGLELFARHRDVSERQARLAGAARGLRNASGANIVDHELTRIRGLAFDDLDPMREDLAGPFREGMEMDLDRAVAYALGRDSGPSDR
jgi:hypothetical protein